MAKYLAIFNDTTPEDITVNGFVIMAEKQMTSYEELASSITWDFDYEEDGLELSYISGDDLLEKIEFKELSVQEASLLKMIYKRQNSFIYLSCYKDNYMIRYP